MSLVFGKSMEAVAEQYLKRQGLRLITQNYRTREGEIDLIMRDQATLAFIEVRYRKDDRFGGAAASVLLKKQRRLSRTAAIYLQSHAELNHLASRFDVLALSGTPKKPEIHWIKNAFQFIA